MLAYKYKVEVILEEVHGHWSQADLSCHSGHFSAPEQSRLRNGADNNFSLTAWDFVMVTEQHNICRSSENGRNTHSHPSANGNSYWKNSRLDFFNNPVDIKWEMKSTERLSKVVHKMPEGATHNLSIHCLEQSLECFKITNVQDYGISIININFPFKFP